MFARVARGGDVQKHKLIGALRVIAFGKLDRITGIPQVNEVDALHYTSAGDIETRNDPFGKHQICKKLPMTRRPTGPDFSGWNWTA